MASFFTKLENRIREIDSLLCIGLDPHPIDLHEFTGASAREFCARIISATTDLAAAYKPNIAFFEALGSSGISALIEVIEMIPDDIPVILDAKRGDIASTARAYSRASFLTFGADAVTVNPYLGKDAVDPFIENPDKGAFLLCKTSNPGAEDLQDLMVSVTKYKMVDGQFQESKVSLYIHVAKLAQDWNLNNNLGIVVGATQPEALGRVREVAPDLWILAPGVGAQGGNLPLAMQAGLRKDGLGMLIPVSRGISRASNPRFAAIEMRRNINQQRGGLVSNVTKSKVPNLKTAIADGLLKAGCVKFDTFTLKSGIESPIYIDLRRLVGFPGLLAKVAKAYIDVLDDLNFDLLAALPYAAMPITSSISLQSGWPMVYPRKEIKSYGTKTQIEGVFEPQQKVVVIDDLISTGGSKFEGIKKLESAGLKVEDIVVLIDRSLDGGAVLIEQGYKLHALMTITELLTYYENENKVDSRQIEDVRKFLCL